MSSSKKNYVLSLVKLKSDLVLLGFTECKTINSQKYYWQLCTLRTAIEKKIRNMESKRLLEHDCYAAPHAINLLNSTPLISTNCDRYKIPLKQTFFCWYKKFTRNIFFEKPERFEKHLIFKLPEKCGTKWRLYNLINVY